MRFMVILDLVISVTTFRVSMSNGCEFLRIVQSYLTSPLVQGSLWPTRMS